MAKVPAFSRAFAGPWRIVEMDTWGNDVLDLGEEAHLTFEGRSQGEIAFVALKGFLDVRYGARDGNACAEFSCRDMMKTTKPAAAAGLCSEPRADLSARSSSITLTSQASSASGTSSSTAC